MQDSHTATWIDAAAADSSRLWLVSTATKGLPEWLAGWVDEHLAVFAAHLTQGLLACSTALGLQVMAELMDVEVTELAGPKGKHNPRRVAMRHGSQPGTVTLGGRRLGVRRPRVRGTGADGHEVPLESYAAFASTDLLAEGIVARMLAGLSTRRYSAGLEPVGEPVGEQVDAQASGTSKSAVSRRFVAATAERLSELLARRLDDRRWLVVFLDGFSMGEHLLVGALGVTQDGTKVPGGGRGHHREQGGLHPAGGRSGRPWPGRLPGRAVRHRRRQGPGAGDRCGVRQQGAHPALPPAQGAQRHRSPAEAERPLVQRRLRAACANPGPDQAKAELE
jgi:hypothetical protein